MADTQNAAAAATNPTTEVPKTQSSDIKTDAKSTTTTEVAADTKPQEKTTETNGKSEDAGEQENKVNGKSEGKDERHDERRNGRNDRNNDRNGDRRGGNRGRGRGGFQHRNKKHNEEFDNLPETDDPVEIRNQVEFYFSTYNLVTDEHLFMELGGPRNHPVSIKHLTTFKRMRRFQPYSAVVRALRESKDLIVVDEGEFNGAGKEAVKRKEALVVPTEDGDKENEPTTKDLFYRLKKTASNKLETSVYVKGFGNPDDAGQIALEQFFRPYGSVMVRKRREDDDGTWKGSVFVEFDTVDSQKQFLGLDPKPKYNDNELTIMGKKEYSIMKCDEKGIDYDDETKRRSNGHRSRGGDRDRDGGRGGGRGRGRGRGGRGGRGGDRRDNRDNHSRRDRSNDRSPRRRRDRSASRDSVDSRDWNNRRDRFQKGKNDQGNRKEEERKGIERDAHGVPVVKDTRADAEVAAKNKRKATEEEREANPKKSKLEIKQDE